MRPQIDKIQRSPKQVRATGGSVAVRDSSLSGLKKLHAKNKAQDAKLQFHANRKHMSNDPY